MRLPLERVIGGPGRAFEIAQGRLGPGRIHHCMRLIGLAELALELACRAGRSTRVAFGKPIANLGGNRERIADARIAIDQARLLRAATPPGCSTPAARWRAVGEVVADQGARAEHGPAGHRHGDPDARRRRAVATTCRSPPPGRCARALRLADGPDEVHRGVDRALELASTAPGSDGAERTSGVDDDQARAVRGEDASTSRRVDVLARRERIRAGAVTGTPEVKQFSGGASNLTYLLRYPDRDLILRRPPAGHQGEVRRTTWRASSTSSSRCCKPTYPYVPEMVALLRRRRP